MSTQPPARRNTSTRFVFLIPVLPGLLPSPVAAVVLVPLPHLPYMELPQPAEKSQRSAKALSGGTVLAPNGNVAAAYEAGNWMYQSGSDLSNRFSPAVPIARQKVGGLHEAWHFHHTLDVQPAMAWRMS